MPELLAALDAFMQEHRRCGELDGGMDGDRVWLTCDCGAGIAHPVKPTEPDHPDESSGCGSSLSYCIRFSGGAVHLPSIASTFGQ